jgi:hypothetical protein
MEEEDKLIPLQITSFITAVSARAGNAARIGFNTVELPFKVLTSVLRLKDMNAEITIRPFNKHKDEDPVIVDGDINQKTPSQRLRGAVHVWWVQSGKPGTWETFYIEKMELLLDYVKDKLD